MTARVVLACALAVTVAIAAVFGAAVMLAIVEQARPPVYVALADVALLGLVLLIVMRLLGLVEDQAVARERSWNREWRR